MEAVVETLEEGQRRVHTGITVCEGPGTYRLVLTRPYHEAGRVVEIPRSEIRSIREISPGALGDAPAF
jgi:hypothetical protein